MDDQIKDGSIAGGAGVYAYTIFTPDILLLLQGLVAISLILLTVLRIGEIVYKWYKS